MDAMIFAAGLGTRLRPLTNDVPKALVEIGGIPILEHVARRLIAAGADRLIINTHPHPEMIRSFVEERDGFGVEVLFSHEPDGPLDTAGGIRHARSLFRADAPFFLHNCDVFSNIDLRALYDAHVGARDDRMATLAVLPPSAERYLIFDRAGLCGFGPRGGGEPVRVREPDPPEHHRDFSGIHVCDPGLLETLDAEAAPSVIMHYLALARAGSRIERHDQLSAQWVDIGTHDKLAEAQRLHADSIGVREA
ncbi:MAG TPA: sugar phosphate nucleotidyltransferase [Longimicrobiales bacterium]|nr:sugar phosphate nucleotidyltransferase [Longimicrobiales bacterium]